MVIIFLKDDFLLEFPLLFWNLLCFYVFLDMTEFFLMMKLRKCSWGTVHEIFLRTLSLSLMMLTNIDIIRAWGIFLMSKSIQRMVVFRIRSTWRFLQLIYDIKIFHVIQAYIRFLKRIWAFETIKNVWVSTRNQFQITFMSLF